MARRAYRGQKPDSSTVLNVYRMPTEVQLKIFRNLMRDNGLQVKPSGGTDAPLGDIIGAIAGGIGNTFFPGNPVVAGSINQLVVGGFTAFMRVFSKPKPPPPNIPPVITCPESITRKQDRGQRYATVTWQIPRAFDVEDGEIKNFAVNGERPRSRFYSGDNMVTYKVQDSKGMSDFCSFYITVNETQCGKPELPKGGDKWDCSDDYDYNSTCIVKCAEGFRVDSDDRTPLDAAIVRCQANETWTRSPVCKEIQCPEPEVRVQGETWYCSNSSKPESVCLLKCPEGYSLESPRPSPWYAASMTCQTNGRWSRQPTCKVTQCLQPQLPKGGEAWYCTNGYEQESECLLKCTDGSGPGSLDPIPWTSASIRCQTKGTWTDMPVCKGQ